MENSEFNCLLVKYRLLSDANVKLIEFLNSVYKLDNDNDIKNLISIIFSYAFLGHCYTPIKDLKNNYTEILNNQEVKQKDEHNNESIEEDFSNLKNELDIIDSDIVNLQKRSTIFTDKKVFIINGDLLFIKKYYYASLGIKDSFNRLFIGYTNNNSCDDDYSFTTIKLNDEQKEAIKDGITKNLLITGGPGTGKTTTIVFLLIKLLKDKSKEKLDRVRIHLTAPSGKAADRMSESINNNLINNIKEDFKQSHIDLINKIKSLEGCTIDRLLGYTPNGYKYNKNRKIDSDYENIFIIDEASMIDILKFNSLLDAIKDGSRVFILGDKDQLPSVENGAVFKDLLESAKSNDCKVELIDSNRFGQDTDVYKLSRYINGNEDKYTFDFKDINTFAVEDLNGCEVRYYKDLECTKEDIQNVLKTWYKKYLKDIQKKENTLTPEELKNKSYGEKLVNLNKYLETSKILTVNNNGIRGVNTINKYIKEELFNEKKNDYFNGAILMITQNIKELYLSNGENGICVKINNTLYFMIKKNYENIKEGYQEIGIFKLDGYVFYPMSLIKKEYITYSYAITIHKSQGSEYDNVLIILPEEENNPLFTRQIVYTAITRTKKSCYIISNEIALNASREKVEQRLTKIIDLEEEQRI